MLPKPKSGINLRRLTLIIAGLSLALNIFAFWHLHFKNNTTSVIDNTGVANGVDRSGIKNSAASAPLKFLDSPMSSTTQTHFSSCMLIMDDNHFLIEWLAYHYHVLPLRRLILAVDPGSRTLPHEILERWTQRIEISVWNTDTDYMNMTEQIEAEHWVRTFFKKIPEALVQHRARQRVFYYKCMQQLKRENQGWTLLTDTDEYIHINYQLIRGQSSSSVWSNIKVPTIDEPGSVLKFLEQDRWRPGQNLTTTPCVQIPRLRFGAVESIKDRQQNDPLFNASLLLATLRWRFRAKPENYFMNKISKVALDLQRVDWQQLVQVESIHRPIKALCSQRRMHIRATEQVLVIAHYLGTYEQFTSRENDARKGHQRSKETYNKVANLRQEVDGTARPWLEGFTRDVGIETASELLKNVGEIKPLQ